MTLDEFAGSIKTKYPQYANVDNQTLVNTIVQKYPQYANYASMSAGAGGGTVNSQPQQQQPSPYQPTSPASVAQPGQSAISNFGKNAMSTVINVPGSAMNLAQNLTGNWSVKGTATTAASIAGGVAGAAAGAQAGGVAGAALGSLLDEFLGPLGTAGGYALGTAVGGYMGSWLGSITANSAVTGQNPWNEMGNIAQSYKQKYFANGIQGAAKQIVNDPVGSALDFSIALDGFGAMTKGIGDAAEAGSTAAEAGGEGASSGAKAKPNAMQQMASGMTKTAGAINPITLPFKAIGAVAGMGAPKGVAEAQSNVENATGQDVKMPWATTAGNLTQTLYTIGSWFRGGKAADQIGAGMESVQEAADNIGGKINDAITKGENTNPADAVKQVATQLMNTVSQMKAKFGGAYTKLFKLYGDTELDTNAPTAAPGNVEGAEPGPSISNAIDTVRQAGDSGLISDQTLKDFENILGKNNFTTTEDQGGSDALSTVVSFYDNANPEQPYSQLTKDEQAAVLKKAGLTPEESGSTGGATLKNGWNIIQSIERWASDGRTTSGGARALYDLESTIRAKFGETLQSTPTAEGETQPPSEFWKVANDGWSQMRQIQQNTTFKNFASYLKSAPETMGKGAINILDGLFGSKNLMNNPDAIKSMTNLFGQDGLEQLGSGYLLSKFVSAWKSADAEGKSIYNGDIANGEFDPKKFVQNLASVPKDTWAKILSPQLSEAMDWMTSNSKDLSKLKAAFEPFTRLMKGSPTGELGMGRRIVLPTLTALGEVGAASGIGNYFGGVAGAFGAGIGVTAAGMLFGTVLTSDLANAIMGSDAAAKLKTGMAQMGAGAAGSAQQNIQTLMRSTIPNDKLQQLMKMMVTNPQQAQQIVQEGQQAGYWFPPQLTQPSQATAPQGSQ